MKHFASVREVSTQIRNRPTDMEAENTPVPTVTTYQWVVATATACKINSPSARKPPTTTAADAILYCRTFAAM